MKKSINKRLSDLEKQQSELVGIMDQLRLLDSADGEIRDQAAREVMAYVIKKVPAVHQVAGRVTLLSELSDEELDEILYGDMREHDAVSILGTLEALGVLPPICDCEKASGCIRQG